MTTIYHYCDVNAFLSIMQGKKLRLCSTSKMNDANEGSLVGRAILGVMEKSIKTNDFKLLKATISMAKDETYACCFSSDEDSVVQWMNYADQGKGFAIGFDADKLVTENDCARLQSAADYFGLASDNLPNNMVNLGPVVYYDAGAERAINASLSRALNNIEKNEEGNSNWWPLFVQCTWFDTITKDASFTHEGEYRMCHIPMPRGLIGMFRGEYHRNSVLGELHWRVSRYGLAPYYEFEVPPESITEIYVGPRNPDHHGASGTSLVEMFCRLQGVHGAKVKMSKSPYRG
jgi:hypothetical protein